MRCFLAVVLPAEIRQELAEVQREARQLGLKATWPGAGEMHATLAFYGELDGNALREKIEALSAVSFKPFEAAVSGVGFFPDASRPRVFWAGVNGLEALQAETSKAAGYRNDKPFHGHVTLCRVKGGENVGRLAEFAAKTGNRNFGAFTVSEFVLKESKPTARGPVYIDLQKFGLAERG